MGGHVHALAAIGKDAGVVAWQRGGAGKNLRVVESHKKHKIRTNMLVSVRQQW